MNLIVLNSLEELTYSNRSLLTHEFSRTEPDFAEYRRLLIKNTDGGVYNKVKDNFYSGEYRGKIAAEMERRGIICVTLFSENYPENLKNTPCPPAVLYCLGNAELLKTRRFAVVGSRRTVPNVMTACRKISREISERFTVVTGIADGADSAAVEGALESGKVISVLAYGFDYAYPAYNERLIYDVGKRGLLLSEYPPQTPPRSYQFPVRNRIIAGLSEGVLVVSAGEKSGASITADYAAEYGREVFAFPYGIGVSSGVGCNSLIKKGAYLTENILDIFGVFGLDFIPNDKKELSDDEKKLLELISETGEIFVADAARQMGKLPYQLIPLLSSLEIKGLAVRLGGNRYGKG